ncbi:hypothetical protein JTE90_027317 [Oedothorax gibbosus]|uniref:Uncharacterized protein n=1 Tax=Oedothorax gibbosus TaxID=931172 RepID=A0AAV6VXV1_9ARAC|nr:hypothetical protein JTE90_027317 [Oedothorax gibbosus]
MPSRAAKDMSDGLERLDLSYLGVCYPPDIDPMSVRRWEKAVSSGRMVHGKVVAECATLLGCFVGGKYVILDSGVVEVKVRKNFFNHLFGGGHVMVGDFG